MISSASALSFCPDTLPHGPPCRWETCLGATGWKSAKVTPPTPRYSCQITLTSQHCPSLQEGFSHEGGLLPAQVLSHPSSVIRCVGGPGTHSLRGWGQGSRPSPAARWTGLVLLLLLREIEYKELQLSLDQVSTSKCQDSWRTALSTSQETRKLAKPKNTKMKTKLRTNPYPPQVTPRGTAGAGCSRHPAGGG